ncbi:LysR family transcriptional regulator [Aeromonas media]|uniref:LysR family transcriptional regulator n=1 Tax=Aeromonas media TaxID=651 RepID=UPI00148B1549|nr:LysR family transcriptional regulator [Aeromonas media]QJT27455.1 LysR family transcriptional regulator [Aeromonas media]BBS87014.1 LysR family transcriptional regulator [Aeromonas media]
MDQLRRYAIFAAVVEAGTMTGAAKALGMTPSAVSQHIGQLESLLGLTLLHRSTRRLSLTEAGEVVWQGCQALQQTLNQTELRLSEVRDSLLGEVRITAPVGMAGQPLAQALSPLLQAHPGLCIQIIADDEKRDLIKERIDVALRVGALPDSTLVARKLGQTRMLLCAAPAYLARRGTPRTPAELVEHDWLCGDMLGSGLLLLDERGGEHRLRFKPRVICNNVLPLRQFALAGQGISLQPEGEVAEDLAQGRLLALLPGFRVPPMEIHAITPQREIPEKVRRVITALRSHFAEPAGTTRLL